jgi:hypothetical protein
MAEPPPHEGESARLAVRWVDRPLPGFRPAGRLHDLFAFVECAEDNDAALTSVEGRSKRLLPVDGFRSRVDRPWPPPVPRVREPPAHLDHPSRARFTIPNNDRQQTANAIGDNFVVAAPVASWAFASAALGERLGKCDDFAPGCQGREFTAHGGTRMVKKLRRRTRMVKKLSHRTASHIH